jgi:hypothetical protein
MNGPYLAFQFAMRSFPDICPLKQAKKQDQAHVVLAFQAFTIRTVHGDTGVSGGL